MATSENNPSLDHSKVSERSEGVQSPYDRLVNRTLQQIDSARSLLEFHLPKELLEHLKLSRSFPGHQAKNLLDTIRTYVMSVNPIVGEEKINEMVSDFWPVQPELGSVADQLIKKGEATGRILGEATGEARGETRGEIRLIQTLQAILRVPQSSNEDFNGKTLEQLRSITEELQQQILKRPS